MTAVAPNVVRWETLTKRSFDALDRSRCVVFVTASPMEVHGPHLPFGTDCFEGDALAERIIRVLPDRHRARTFLRLPVCYAASDVVPQAGSLAFRPGTTVAFLEDLGNSLAAQGFRDVLVSNFHGGPRHFVAIEKACDRVTRRRGIRMVSVFSLMLSRLSSVPGETLEDLLAAIPGVRREDLRGDTHAGLLETSQLLALHGELVDPGYESLPPVTFESWLARRQSGRGDSPKKGLRGFLKTLDAFRGNVRFFLTETYSGAPAGASAELGTQFLDRLAGSAAGAVTEILDETLSPLACHSPLWPYRFFLLNPLMIRLSNRLLGFSNPIA